MDEDEPNTTVPAKRKPGRPRDPRRPELEENVLANIRLGQGLRAAALAAGVPYSSVQRWEDDADFAARVEAAKAERQAGWLRRMDDEKLGWQRWAWKLERTSPEEYGRADRPGSPGDTPTVNFLVGTLNVLQQARHVTALPPPVELPRVPQFALAPAPAEEPVAAVVEPEPIPEPEPEPESLSAPTPEPELTEEAEAAESLARLTPDLVREARQRW